MAKHMDDPTQGTPFHGDHCDFPCFVSIVPPMIATLQLPGLTIGLPVWFFSTPTILDAPTASHVTTTSHEHQIKVNPFLSSTMQSSPPPSSLSGKSIATNNNAS